MKQKVIILLILLFSAIAMQAQVADYTITNVSTCPDMADNGYGSWYKNSRKLTVTFASTQGANQSSDLYMEITPKETQYLGQVACRIQRPAISERGTVTETFNFTNIFGLGNFTDGESYKLTFYKGEDQSSPYDFTVMMELYSLDVTYSKDVMVEVEGGFKFDTFSCSDNVDFRNANNTDVIAAYTVSYETGTPDKVTLKRHKKVLPANTGVVVYAPTSTKFQVLETVESTTATVDAGNKMVAVTAGANVDAINDGKFNYVVSEDKFSALLGPTFIEGGKAYLSIVRSPVQYAREFSIIDDPTGIDEVQEENTFFGNGQIYTIQGQKAGYLQPGHIYICNGKKVLVK